MDESSFRSPLYVSCCLAVGASNLFADPQTVDAFSTTVTNPAGTSPIYSQGQNIKLNATNPNDAFDATPTQPSRLVWRICEAPAASACDVPSNCGCGNLDGIGCTKEDVFGPGADLDCFSDQAYDDTSGTGGIPLNTIFKTQSSDPGFPGGGAPSDVCSI